jgi:molybdopterin-containing oxidoreductase family iron-sulfur binding subunit
MKPFDKDIPVEDLANGDFSTTRRDFLKLCGISISAAVLAACEKTPVKYALPYVKKPAEHIPTIPDYYATSFFDGQIFQSILAKVRDGRPIKIEGNPSYPLTEGGTHVRGQAAILTLYDHTRLQKPLIDGQAVDWVALGAPLMEELKKQSGLIYLLTPPILSPSLRALIQDWLKALPNARHIIYEAIPYDGIRTAHEQIFGKAALPTYRFEKAQVIVSFAADFLGTWGDPTTHARGWSKNRILYGGRKDMSLHIQFEAVPTITGYSADKRIPLEATDLPKAVLSLYNHIAQKAGAPLVGDGAKWDTPDNAIAYTAEKLWEARGQSLVVSGSHLPAIQALVVGINLLLDNYGQTLFITPSCNLRQAREKDFLTFLADLEEGRVGAVLFHQVNPLYDAPEADRLQAALAKVPLTIAIHTHLHETASACKYVLAENHFLESWGDAEPYEGLYTLQQPTIHPIFSTKSFAEILLSWLGRSESHYDYLKAFWQKEIFPQYVAYRKAVDSGKATPFWPEPKALPTDDPETFWIRALEEGVVLTTTAPATQPKANWKPTEWLTQLPQMPADGLTLYLYEKVTIGDGTQAGNPWLQETPDPLSRVSWDNYFVVSPLLAREMGLRNGDMAKLSLGEKTLTLPVYILPGTAPKTIGVALGYGRTKGGRAAVGVGQNAYPFFGRVGEYRYSIQSGASLTKTGETYKLARIQEWETYSGREYIRETSLSAYREDPKAGNHEEPHLISLWWKEHPMPGHRWGMAIDLNTCIGCASCVVACIAENNIPVVGRDEIRRGRDMHWIRIDRYFTSTAGHTGKPEEFPAKPAEDFPRAFFMPMLCQHCDHAPCETVCPVLAIAHSSEGINQQVYNRCVGTRYCANNCPYKVRRFNWFDYTNAEKWVFNPVDELGRMVLNPDVTVRARGVMEKCSFCVQRIQAAKLEAKKAGQPLQDGAVKTACEQACPTGAITFGDLNDPNSRVSKLMEEPRGYYALSELNVRPSIRYMVKVRNTELPQTQTT